MKTLLLILFWLFAFIVFYTFFGYGMLLYVLVKIKERRHPRKEFPHAEEYPDVTLLIAAYNEEDIVAEKMANCDALDYPKDKLHIVWVTDGSSDSTPDRLREYKQNTVLHSPERKGKTAALNRAMAFVNTPFVVMTDANTELNPECISLIVREFDDPSVGCVAGEKRVLADGQSAASTEGLYWRYECYLKDLDSRLYSAMGAPGELIAIRRELWQDIPEDSLLDDMILSMGIVKRGYRISYCPKACACERPSASIADEGKRKRRITAGGFQTTFWLRDMMNPFKYGVVAFQFFSHRALRWVLTPSLMVLLMPLNIALVCCGAGPLYTVLLVLQVLFYLCAYIGYRDDKQGRKSKFTVPYYFVFANFSTFQGYVYYRRFNGNAAWEKAKRAK